LSNLQDTNVAATATELSQLQVQQEASMSAEANIQQMKNLFSYLA